MPPARIWRGYAAALQITSVRPREDNSDQEDPAGGREAEVDLMMDGGVNANNCAAFVKQGMTVAEMSSPLFKGPNGKLQPGTGDIPAAVARVRQALDQAGNLHRTANGIA